MALKEATAKKRRYAIPRKGVKSAKRNVPEILLHCEAIGINSRVLSPCLAVNPKTIQRWRDGIAEPGEAALRTLEKLEAVYQLTVRLIRKDSWEAWLRSPNQTLGNESPVDLLIRGEVDQVRNVLGLLEWGIYS